MKNLLKGFALDLAPIGRMQYFVRGLTANIVTYTALLSLQDSNDALSYSLVGALALYNFIGIVKRLGDLQKPWTYAFLALVPIVNLIFGFYLLFTAGVQATLKLYGNDPYEYAEQ